jgi:hypothetical protein
VDAAEEAPVGAAESAYSQAANGGRNSGFLRQAAQWSRTQLKRAFRSFQIEVHEAKIADPASYASDWANMSEQAQQGLINHWYKEIELFSAQQSIVEELLFRMGP